MKKITIILLVFVLFISCENQSELHKIFKCTSVNFDNTSSILDFNKNFKLTIPTTWKTDLYYDNFQSEIFSADTTKQLTETFILDASFNFGKLEFTTSYFKKNDSILKNKNLELIEAEKGLFQQKPSYWYLVKGSKNGFPYHQLNLTVKLSENTYFNAFSEIYGEENVNDRICEFISIIDKVEFLQ